LLKERGSSRRKKGLFSPQNKPPPSQETGQKRPTNPLQKALLYKDVKNARTPLKLFSNPLKVLARSFTARSSSQTPGPWPPDLTKTD